MKNYILLLFATTLFQVNAQEFEVRTVVVEEGTNTQQGTYKYLKPMLVLEANGSSAELYQKAILALDVPIVPNPGKAEKAVGTIAQKLSVAYTFKFLALFFD